MTDRELLELAAKAAGIERRNAIGFYIIEEEEDNRYWNPLTDDGDALRLAVNLGISVFRDDDIVWVNNKSSAGFEDPYAATRRAIVRAAAEIGKEMK